MDDEALGVGLGPLIDRIEGLEALVAEVRRELKKRSDAGKLKQDHKSATDGNRQWPSPKDQQAGLGSLAEWVDELQMEYSAAGDWLVPCWWQHGFAVNELIALRTAWLGLKTSDEPSAALDWHEAAEKCRVRIHTAIGDGPGCTPVEHYPERPRTKDHRWVEERRLMETLLTEGPK
jgi:hypothetical protein